MVRSIRRLQLSSRECGFMQQSGPVRHMAVPFDQCGYRAGEGKSLRVEIPGCGLHGTVMAVDEQWCALRIVLAAVPGEVDFADGMQREFT